MNDHCSVPATHRAAIAVASDAGGDPVTESVRLDVRPVPPMHRYERIMGTYESLLPGSSMLLTVDHDPRCMYYTLRATRGDHAFTFDYLENGPETWQVRVTRMATQES